MLCLIPVYLDYQKEVAGQPQHYYYRVPPGLESTHIGEFLLSPAKASGFSSRKPGCLQLSIKVTTHIVPPREATSPGISGGKRGAQRDGVPVAGAQGGRQCRLW